jgi:murein DD-endopeptidase MepM/ murein hydrolase activator NlpD
MTQDPYPEVFDPEIQSPPVSHSSASQKFLGIWEAISHAGLAEITYRLGTHTVLVALILLVAWGLREFYLLASLNATNPLNAPDRSNTASRLRTLGQTIELSENSLSDVYGSPLSGDIPVPDLPVELPSFGTNLAGDTSVVEYGIPRFAQIHTDIPSHPRGEVITYTVKLGDTLFGIAKQFGLKPETILWSNQPILGDNPHNLQPGQELNILPVDGAYHRWSTGDGLNGVAKFFGVEPADIIDFSGNHLDPAQIGDWSNPKIEAGSWLVIPGGRREFVSWSAPYIPRDNPALAKVLGPGACDTVVGGGALGSGNFIWPTDNHFLSGYDYEPDANHPGIDIAGDEGNPVYAPDNGVVVYAGWNNWGYGNVVVINHGNGWQTLFAHLSSYYVSCGQSVYQGNAIGAVGSTGKADGAHLHFEMMYNGVRVNPHEYIT